jgi:hypothetical protein
MSQAHLVETDDDITLDSGSQVDLGLEVELDAQEEGGVAEGAVILGGALDELACWLGQYWSVCDGLRCEGRTSGGVEASGGGERDSELLTIEDQSV